MCSLGSCEIQIPATTLPVLNSLINDLPERRNLHILFFRKLMTSCYCSFNFLNADRISSTKMPGCSNAAKWPPCSASFQ
jgi:hypothetical protein